tara:strand:+ start:100 stop:432 length:333 start_codon:yes stop_codon:yes gene_type:complete
MEERTIFHKIIDGEIPSDIVYEDDEVLIFKDINPKAPTHLLLIPKNAFVSSIADLTEETLHVPAMLIYKAKQLADDHGIEGYQLKFHVGRSGGQEVFYLHLHFLSQTELT